jgi:di/tricarboxylate transporter
MRLLELATIVVAVTILLTTRVVPVEVVAIGIPAVLGLFGILPPDRILQGFAQPAVFLVASLFVLSEGLSRTKVIHRITLRLMMLVHRKKGRIGLIVTPAVGIISMLLNDTGAFSLFLPAIKNLISETGASAKRIWMPVGFAALLGGSATLFGSASNIIISGYMESRHQPGFKILDFLPIGGGAFLIGLLYLWIVVPRTFPEEPQSPNRTGSSGRSFFVELLLDDHFPYRGMKFSETPLAIDWGLKLCSPVEPPSMEEPVPNRKGSAISLLKAAWGMARMSGKTAPAGLPELLGNPDQVLKKGDRIRLQVDVVLLGRILDLGGVRLQGFLSPMTEPEPSGLTVSTKPHSIDSEETVLLEAIMQPDVGVIHKRLRQMANALGPGVEIAGLFRESPPQEGWLGETLLSPGDVLLLKGTRTEIEAVQSSGLFLSLNEIPRKVFRTSKAPLAVFIAVSTISVALSGLLPVSLSALLGAFLMMAFGVVRMEEARDSIDWRVLLLMGGLFPLGWSIEDAGVGGMVAPYLLHWGVTLSPIVLLGALMVLAGVLVQFFSHTLVALTLAPLVLSLVHGMGLSPKPFMMGLAISSMALFLSPLSHPVNLLSWNEGEYRFRDYFHLGFGLFILTIGWGIWIIPKIWPLVPGK